jgi:SAM-dependent methyltransferase
MHPREFGAAQDFLLAAKRFWSTTMYATLRNEYDATLRRSERERPLTVQSVADILEGSPTYQYFAWLERHLQKMKYSGAYGLEPFYDERREQVLQHLDAAPVNAELTLDPTLRLPDYYSQVDIHQHPGGLWSDEIAGFIYECGARTTTPLLGASHLTLHDRFTAQIAAQGAAKRILDMGCGFGKSTRPFAATFGESRIDAIDLSAACLRLASANGMPSPAAKIHYRQMNAADLAFPAASFDLVTSTMLLHEIPPAPLRRVLEEAFRVLEPSGRMVHLDFYLLPDEFRRFLHYGHARRNNEPYMQPLAELDLPAVLRAVGFSDCSITPFRETDDDAGDSAWRFPWTVISARKPAA